MDCILLITDNPRRSRSLAHDLAGGLPCEIHDPSDAAPAEAATTLVADIDDYSSETVERLRRLLA